MYPKIIIDLKKIEKNTRIVTEICKEKSVDIMGVTKVFCGDLTIAEAELKGGIKYFADSRIENLRKLKTLDLPKVLLRLPMISQVDDVVMYTDISLNSEMKTIEALNIAAMSKKKIHKIILMIDLGDLREGILPAEFEETVEAIFKLKNIMLHGIGVNLTCYGGVIPNENNLGQLSEFATMIKDKYNHHLEIVSGGNSSSFYLLPKDKLPGGINNLRMGEILVLGRETAYGDLVEGMYDDAFIFETEIVELKEKESIPIGEIGMDAFGNKPTFTDKGKRMRAIVAAGVQDVNANQLIPLNGKISYLGASSDHMIWDVTDADYKLGDIIQFKVEYGALLSLFTSEYITKEYK